MGACHDNGHLALPGMNQPVGSQNLRTFGGRLGFCRTPGTTDGLVYRSDAPVGASKRGPTLGPASTDTADTARLSNVVTRSH